MPSGDTPDLNLLFPQRTAAAEQKLFGRYTLKRVLGRGGMGIVWMAHDDELHRYVAMKFLPDMLIRDREAVNDLKRETRRSLDLTHHHIVRIYDFTQDDVCAAIIMEYVDGETLSAMKTQQPGGCFSVSTIAAWVAHFCQALDYAHRQARVVHRDLKPANLMVNSRGDLKVTDFGISRSMSDSMTRVSMSNTAGTLAYMSPEQALGAPPAACDDVYAFGATIYDLLTGRPPFFRGNIQVQLETVIPPKLAERREELGNQGEPISSLWEEVIAKCLAKRPHDRPQTMGEIAMMLGLGGPASTLRTPFSSGTASGTASGSPGTASTRARTSTTEDAATRTDSVPPVPQTTRPGSAATRATSFISTPRPTALRDVIPGYLDEAAEAAAEATPPTQPPPATTPTQAKAEEPSSPEIATPVEPEPALEPPVAEAPEEIEIPAEPAAAPVVEQEPQPACEEDLPAPAVDVVPLEFVEKAPDAGSIEPPAAEVAPVREEPPVVKEPVSMGAPPSIEAGTPFANEELPASGHEIAEENQAGFPTMVGEPLIEPTASDDEEIPPIELPATKVEDVIVPSPPVEAEAEPEPEVAEEPKETTAATLIDEAAATLAGEPRPEPPHVPVPTPAPVTPIPLIDPVPRPEPAISRSIAVEEALPPPSRGRSKAWLPIAGITGIAVAAGIWMVVSKDSGKQTEPVGPVTTPRPVDPTPVPIVPPSEPKLQRARELMATQEFPEAIALLKNVQQLDPKNEEAANLLREIDRLDKEREMKAQRQAQIDALFAKAEAALNGENWAEMRTALEDVLKIDPQNASAISRLNDLKSAQDEWARVEQQREREAQAEKDREKKLADMQAEQEREKAKEKEQERPRNTAQDETPRKRTKAAATPRPRPRVEEDNSDRPPPRRTASSNEDERPPAPSRVQPARRPASTPVPAPPPSTQPKKRVPWVGPPGG